MKVILVDHGTRKEIARVLKCTYPTIKKALECKSDTLLSRKIRQAAINRGGRWVESINQ